MKYLLAAIAVFAAVIGLAAALFESSSRHDRDNFAAARNACERGCIQDSGGLDQCRQFCKPHPDHYP